MAPGLLQALGALLELRAAAPHPLPRSQLAAMLDAALVKLARSLTALLGAEAPLRQLGLVAHGKQGWRLSFWERQCINPRPVCCDVLLLR